MNSFEKRCAPGYQFVTKSATLAVPDSGALRTGEE